MELGTIERDIHVDASPETVFTVISTPEHIQEWWPDEAAFESVAGAPGEIAFRDGDTGEVKRVNIEVAEVDPPKRFSFRWCFAEEAERAGSSLLVTFDLVPTETGTLVRMSEVGFREMGWEVAVLEEAYADHVAGWDFFLGRLTTYAPGVAA